MTKLFFAGLCATSLTVAVGFALMGYWPILPFAGAELVAVGVALYVCHVRSEKIEVISLDGDYIAVEKGRKYPQKRWDFDRHWVQVALLKSRIHGHSSQLVLRSHGQQVEVGDFLAEEERSRLAVHLRGLIAAPVASDHVRSHGG